jgi:hypothetical protein
MFKRLWKIYHPELFQGKITDTHYFEGWYFKVVDRPGKKAFAFIAGISLGEDKEDSHAFIQFFDGKTGSTDYVPFPVDDFRASEKEFAVYIGDNFFSQNRMTIKIDANHRKIAGELTFKDLVPYPKTLLSPGIMGWYNFVPFMECKHGVVSLDHTVSGSLSVDGTHISFDGGRGYIEKDYGHSFPSSYVWMQSNHFQEHHASFMLSVATIPWIRKSFTGFLGALWFDGELYRFATYTGALITRYERGEREVSVAIEDKKRILEVKAIWGDAWALRSPEFGMMDSKIYESLTSTIHLSLLEKSGRGVRTLFEATGRNAGVEIMDDKGELAGGIEG